MEKKKIFLLKIIIPLISFALGFFISGYVAGPATLKLFGINYKSSPESCSKVCELLYNSSNSFVDNLGNCWCKTRTTIYVRNQNKIVEIESLVRAGVILNVKETILLPVTVNATR